MADADKPKEPRSKLYPLILTLILILGAVGFIMFLAWLSKGPRVRIPFFLIAIPVVILIGIAQLLDDLVLKIAPRMVRNRDRALLAHKLGRDPVTGLPPDLLRLAPGQAAVPQQPWGAAPPAQPVGVQAAAGGGRTPTGYTNLYGQTPHAPYGQIPTGYTPPDGRAQSEYGRTPTDPQPSAQQNAPRGRRPPACDDDSSSA